jgi:hypothetical protein
VGIPVRRKQQFALNALQGGPQHTHSFPLDPSFPFAAFGLKPRQGVACL